MPRAVKDTRAIEKSDRFEDLDWRNVGRVIQITGPHVERSDIDPRVRYDYVVDEAPKNTSTIGRTGVVSDKTLRRRFRRLSR